MTASTDSLGCGSKAGISGPLDLAFGHQLRRCFDYHVLSGSNILKTQRTNLFHLLSQAFVVIGRQGFGDPIHEFG